MPIIEEGLPFLHPNIDLADLKPNRKLLRDKDIAKLEIILKNQPDGRIRKSDKLLTSIFPQFPYGIIKFGEEIFAIYKGCKQGKQIYSEYIEHQHRHKKVKLCQELKSGEWFVLKVEASPFLPSQQTVDHEGNVLYRVRHELIQRRFDSMNVELSNIKKYGPDKLQPRGRLLERISTFLEKDVVHSRSKVSIFFIMPLLPGLSLLDFLNHQYRLTTFRWLEVALKILNTVREFHKNQLLHRDIKVDNLIYDYLNHDVTMIDLEFTRQMDEANKYKGRLAGTFTYLAPEIAQHYFNHPNESRKDYHYSEYTEAYALGVALKIIFGIAVPKIEELAEFRNIAACKTYRIGHEKEIKAIESIKSLLEKLTSQNPTDRHVSPVPLSKDNLLLDGIIDVLKPIHAKLLEDAFISTAILDVRAALCFLERALPLDKERFFTTLQRFDEVTLVTIADNNGDNYFRSVKLQKMLADANLIYKIPCHKNILHCANFAEVSEIPSFFKEKNSSAAVPSQNGHQNGHQNGQSHNHSHPKRSFSYFEINHVLNQADAKKFIAEGIDILRCEPKKSKLTYLENIADGKDLVAGQDYAFITASLEQECRRLAKKYDLNSLQRNENPNHILIASPELHLANYRHTVIKHTLDSIVNLANVRLSYAGVTALIGLILTDNKFTTAPNRSFFKTADCVANVKKLQAELEIRRAPCRRL